MRIELKMLTGIASLKAGHFDLHEEFGVACLVEAGENRWARDLHPDLPPFELAVFDLASETAAKQDFAPVEAALTTAGFAMNEIKFQPSSTGKIIASDIERLSSNFAAWPSTCFVSCTTFLRLTCSNSLILSSSLSITQFHLGADRLLANNRCGIIVTLLKSYVRRLEGLRERHYRGVLRHFSVRQSFPGAWARLD